MLWSVAKSTLSAAAARLPRLLRRPDELRPDPPFAIQLEHTSSCRLQCIGCPHFYQHGRLGQHLDMRVIEKLTEIFPRVERLKLCGGGEPFIYPRIHEALDIYARYQLELTAITNLFHLTEEIVAAIRKSFVSLSVSCDGATKDTYEGIRKNASFDRFIENVNRVRSGAPQIDMVMGVTVFRQNLRELPDLVRMARRLGFDKVVVGRMIPRPESMPHTVLDDITNYPRTTNRMYEQARRAARDVGISAIVPTDLPVEHDAPSIEAEAERMATIPAFPDAEYARDLAANWWRAFRTRRDEFHAPLPVTPVRIEADLGLAVSCQGACEQLYDQVFINANGDVAACSQTSRVSMGNLLEVGSFFDLWHGPGLVSLRRSFHQGRFPAHCHGCHFFTQGLVKDVRVRDSLSPERFRSLRR